MAEEVLNVEIVRYKECLHIKVLTGAIERKEAYIDIIDVRSVCLTAFDEDCVQIVFTDGSQKNLNWKFTSKVDDDTAIDTVEILFAKLREWKFQSLIPL